MEAVVISSLYLGDGPLAGADGSSYAAMMQAGGIAKSNAMQMAYTQTLPEFMGDFGNIFVAVCLLFFAFSTIVSWNLFGKLNVQALFNNNKIANTVYAVVSVGFIFLGSILQNDLVWELTDFFNYLMVIPNVIAMFALVKIAKNAAKKSSLKD